MTLEKALRRIESECRENQKAFGKSYAPKWRVGKTYGPMWTGPRGAPMRGAMAEARGVYDFADEIRVLCRKLRRQHRSSEPGERKT